MIKSQDTWPTKLQLAFELQLNGWTVEVVDGTLAREVRWRQLSLPQPQPWLAEKVNIRKILHQDVPCHALHQHLLLLPPSPPSFSFLLEKLCPNQRLGQGRDLRENQDYKSSSVLKVTSIWKGPEKLPRSFIPCTTQSSRLHPAPASVPRKGFSWPKAILSQLSSFSCKTPSIRSFTGLPWSAGSEKQLREGEENTFGEEDATTRVRVEMIGSILCSEVLIQILKNLHSCLGIQQWKSKSTDITFC